MVPKIYSASVIGIDAYVVTVEMDPGGGLPGFNIIGESFIPYHKTQPCAGHKPGLFYVPVAAHGCSVQDEIDVGRKRVPIGVRILIRDRQARAQGSH